MRHFILCLLLLCSVGLFAQAPSGFRFQAVARDANNDVMATDNIAVRISLLRGGPTGAVDYSERHEVTTTDLGVFDLHIGNGAFLSGDINSIDWGMDSYFLKVDIDPDGGDAYINLGASQLLSVPYALYAKESGSGSGGGNPTDELQNLIYDPTTQTLTLTDGNSVTLQVGGGGSSDDNQTISLSGTTLSIENGNTVDLSALQDGVEDADADPTNEIQNLSFDAATNTLSIAGGNSITIPSGGTDADADPNNELQTISISGNQLTLSDGGGTVTLPTGGGTDSQTLTFNPVTNELSISGGNTVTIPSGGTDADADPMNEIQTITISGSVITLSDGGGTLDLTPLITGVNVEDADADPSNELQTISKSGNTVTLSNGGGTFLDATADADADPNNELQTLSLSTSNQLTLSQGGGTVNLSGLGGTSLWTERGSAIYRTGDVAIGTSNPESGYDHTIFGDVFMNSSVGAFHIGFPNNGNNWRMSTSNAGADLLFRSKNSGSTTFNTRFRMFQTGEFAVGNISTPEAFLHVVGNSNISKPQLKLEESGNDYARLELTNTSASGSYWHLAGLPSTTAANARLNFYFRNGSGGSDRMTLTGDGELGINGVPTARVELYQRGQAVGTGLRFDDGTANQDWDITHGFSLR
ncbi:MAG: hypothetical protein AAF840_12475, partial [Bacteroidota bacterium]